MNFSEESKVWVYQSDKIISEAIQEKILAKLGVFCKEWTAHSHQLKAKAEIKYNCFIILMVDESQANTTGCSIDKSVHFLQEIEREFGLELFNRMHFAYEDAAGDVQVLSREDFEIALNKNIINKDTKVFNNLVNTKKELENDWKIPFGKSWHTNFFVTSLR